MFKNQAHQDLTGQILILLSDGMSDPDAATAAANVIKEEDVRLITIGLGEQSDATLLQSLASEPSDYHYTPDSAQLETIYRTLAETIRPRVAATNIEFEHSYDAENFELIPESVSPRKGVDISEGTLAWHVPDVSTTPRRFSYRLRPRKDGEFDIARDNTIHYVKCDVEPGTLHPTITLPVTVRARRAPRQAPVVRPTPQPPVVYPPEVIWQPDKAMLIGIGGTGRRVLTHVKKNLLDAGAGRLSNHVRMVVLDTSEYELINNQQVPVEFAGVMIESNEVVVLNENLAPLLRRMVNNLDSEPEVRDFLPDSDYNALPDGLKNLAFGTNARRPMARAGLVRQLQQGLADNTAQLWQLLLQATRDVANDGSVRVILVGSLAGGMSGALFDVCHLVRQAAQVNHGDTVSVRVEGYLALDTVFQSLAANPPTLAANTFGALRELRRFQLNPGVAYPMIYQQGAAGQAASSLLAGASTDKLFTDVFFFGERIELGNDPTISTFPAMADLITLRLDRASQGAGPADWHSGMRNEAARYSTTQHELAIGTAGSFVYRLPAYDVMEEVKTRWVRTLVQAFLMGDQSDTLVLDPTLVSDPGLLELSPDPARLVPIFLEGDIQEASGENQFEAAAALVALIAGQMDDRFEIGLRDAEQQDRSTISRSFEAELSHTLRLILTGTEKAHVSQSRAGKLAYALVFLDTLVTQLDQAEVKLANLIDAPDIDDRSRKQLRALQAIRGDYRKIAESFRAKLRQTGRAISRRALNETGGPDGLHDALEKHAAQLGQWRQEMEAIRVRKYLWTIRQRVGADQTVEYDLTDLWYQDQARDASHPEQYVEHLTWEALSDGTLGLSLLVRENDQLVRKTLQSVEDVPAFMQALLNLAGSVLQDAWKAHNLPTVMESHGLLSERQSPQTAETLLEPARPILTFEPSRAGQARPAAVLGLSEQLAMCAQPLLKHLSETRADKQQNIIGEMTQLATTDRYALQLVRTIDVIPLTAVERLMQDRNKLSARDHYLQDRDRRVVFGAEVEAERWERQRRVERDGLGDLTLHPLVVAALAQPERARQYALALASGLVEQERSSRRVVLRLPDQSRAYPLLSSDAPASVAPLVMGLLVFSLQPPATLSNQLAQIEQIVTEPSEELLERWATVWAERIPATFQTGPSDHQDLGAWIRLVVRYELAQRFGRS